MYYTAIIILLVSEAFLKYIVIFCKREKNKSKQLDIVVHTYNSGTQEKETGESGAQGHLWLHYDFKVSLGHVRSYFNTIKIVKRKSAAYYILQ